MLLILRIKGVAPYASVFIQAVSKLSLAYLSPSFLRLAQALYPCFHRTSFIMRLQKHELLVPKEVWRVRAFLRFCKSYPACSVRLSHCGLFIKYNWLCRWNECGNKSLKYILEYNSIGISTKYDRKRVKTRWNGLLEGCIITNTDKCSRIRIIQRDADSKLNTVNMMAT